ncbi:hypothetical protein RSSM_01870 [Rhodopirellula sallentina SM41]|uniref:Uncharacterized protein n=1 Tax=Rhodopirellula sallentina SM41 TaxID=1263870 RepID=M5UL02_9BACT|nr:hypothetical protein RSSM_01870 [Rhodopirellula sallentina SM41]
MFISGDCVSRIELRYCYEPIGKLISRSAFATVSIKQPVRRSAG